MALGEYGVILLRVVLAGTFLLAGWGKLSGIDWGLAVRSVAAFARMLLPLGEIYLGGWLLLGWRPGLAALVAVGFLLGATGYLLTGGRGGACHCFGAAHPTPWPLAIARNISLGVVAGLVLWSSQWPAGISPARVDGIAIRELVLVVGLGLVWTLGVVLLHSGWSLMRSLPTVPVLERGGEIDEH